jgi:hypothetical protein
MSSGIERPWFPESLLLGKFVETLAHCVFRYRFRRLRTSDGLCVVHLPVPRVTSRPSDGRGSANKVEFLLSKPVQIVFG